MCEYEELHEFEVFHNVLVSLQEGLKLDVRTILGRILMKYVSIRKIR